MEKVFNTYGTVNSITFVDPHSFIYTNNEFELTSTRCSSV